MCAAYVKVENKLVTCPYDAAHKLKESRMQMHIAKCRLNHLDKPKVPCPFNAKHLFSPEERDYHVLNCPDRAPLDRKLTQSLNKNNPFKGNLAVPSYSESFQVECEESWDDEMIPSGCSYVNLRKAPPPGAIIEPPPLSKPSERRKLYQELHRIQNMPEKSTKPVTQVITPRQPMQPSETQKMQNEQKQQQLKEQAFQNLGCGRGRPHRIAANFFDYQKGNDQPQTNAEISGLANVNNSSLGRGQRQPQPLGLALNDENEFPVLGIGRGVFKAPRKNPRAPGTKPNSNN